MKSNSTNFLYLFIVLIIGLIANNAKAQTASQQCKNARAVPDATALDPRSDTIDILDYNIYLDFSQLPATTIQASCGIQYKAKLPNVNQITLDLLALTVDSIIQNGNQLAYTQVGEKVAINLPNTLIENVVDSFRVYYKGSPVEDASGFGGFSFSGGFAYNIGVGFLADPHNYGRVWYPCFDNFVERSTYTVSVKCPENLSAYAGGVKTSETFSDGFKTTTWRCAQEIPSYLASVAVANFEELNYTYQSIINDSLNVKLAAIAADTTALKNAFVDLEPIFHEFETHFGPYKWDRIGYVCVPFGAGAMEHAMNIAYPRGLLPGGAAANKHIMAHELSHMWFGDLATCRTASQMYLNEGFARYCEMLFDEWLVSYDAYMADYISNHQLMVGYCHIKDGGFWPLANVPHEYTYSNSTYERPADILHTLRTYMGDTAFFAGLRYYLSEYSFKDASSDDLKNALEESSGQSLDDCFTDWVDTPGYPAFVVDSFKIVNLTTNETKIYFRQKSHGNTHNYRNVPFELSARNAGGDLFTAQVSISGPVDSVSIELPFLPTWVYLNRDFKISHAVTTEEKFIKTIGINNLPNALIEIILENVQDSTYIRVEHNWVAPDSIKQWNKPYRLSPNRYWTVYTQNPASFYAKAKFTFNGRTNSTSSGWLDNNLVTNDSKVVLLYRKDAADDWQPVSGVLTTFSSTTDKFGNIVIDTLKAGQYTFAEIDSSLGIKKLNSNAEKMEVFPNPANQEINLKWSFNFAAVQAEIYDMQGKSFGTILTNANQQTLKIPISHLRAGYYLVTIRNKSGKTLTEKVMIEHL
jgi:aminopeptidase N